MKAIVQRGYGPPEALEIREVEKPALADDGLLVRVRASSLNPAELYAVTGPLFSRAFTGLRGPRDRIPGVDFAGTVEAVGKDVASFKVGDEVFGARTGAWAEYVSVRTTVVPKPGNVSFEQAGAVGTAAFTALQGLRDKGQLKPGQQVLINGASGGVGTFAVQIAKSLGGVVTAVCSPGNVELVRSLGADSVIDYTREDFTRSGRRYDLLLDIAGSRSWWEYRRVLQPTAIHVQVGAAKGRHVLGPLGKLAAIRLASLGASQRVVFFVARFNRDDFVVLRELMEAGQVKPVVDRRYPLSEVASALRYLGQGHARGKVVLTL